jgi:hypothetical protein
VKPTPRWGPLPWFVLVLTLLLVLLVALLPPLILDEEPPAWVSRSAARVASWHGDPDPIEAEWLQTTREEAVGIMESTVGEASPSPSPTPAGGEDGDGGLPSGVLTATTSPSPIEEPGRAVDLVVMRGRFDSAAPGGPPPPDAPERWIVVAYDSLTHVRWRLVVLEQPPVLPDDAASFEF